MVLVSVIIPTYNRADVLPRAIDSVLDQSIEDYEVIVVDDGSSDNTKQIINSYSDDRISYVGFKSNMGANAARNEGIRKSNGEYISFLDSDDEFSPSYLEKAINTLEQEPDEIIGAFSGFIIIQDGKVIGSSSAPDEYFCLEDVFPGNRIGSFSVTTFRKDVFESVGYLDEKMESAQDLEFYIRVLDEYIMKGMNSSLVRYYLDEPGITDNVKSKVSGQTRLLNKHGDTIPDTGKSQLYLNRARAYAKNSKIWAARKSSLQSIRYNPKNWRSYYFSVFLLFGNFGYQISERLMNKLRKLMVKDHLINE